MVQAAFCFKFKMKDLGVPWMFLGVNGSCEYGKIKLSMKDFITKTAKEHKIEKLARVGCPMQRGYIFCNMTSPLLEAKGRSKYQSRIQAFLFALNIVQVDNCYAVSLPSQSLSLPRNLKAAYKVPNFLS